MLESLVNQNFKKFEVIFSDDNSTDNSISTATRYKKKLKLKIVKGLKRKKFGSYNQMHSILRAFKKSSGEIILFLDSDDFFHHKKIFNVVKFFNSHDNKEKKVIFDLPYIYYSSDNIKKFRIKNKFSKKIWPKFPPQSCISIKKDYFEEIFSHISVLKFPNIWFDFRLAFYSFFIKNNFNILNKQLTYYFQDPIGASSEFKYFSSNWWKRRLEAFKFYKYMFKKFSLQFPMIADYCLTKTIVRIFYFLIKNESE